MERREVEVVRRGLEGRPEEEKGEGSAAEGSKLESAS